MKITRFNKKAVKARFPSHKREEAPRKSHLGWLTTDPRKQKEQAQQARSQSSYKFIPEMWVNDGESKMVRFRSHSGDGGCIGTIWVYSFKTKDGRFNKVTQPNEGDVDLFADELGLRPSFNAIYEVIDIKGFRDKKGKTMRNVSRFFRASHKMHEQLCRIALKRGGLDQQDIEITRLGSGNQTSYMFEAQDKEPMTPEMRKAEKLAPKVADLFKPPTESEQRALLPRIVQWEK